MSAPPPPSGWRRHLHLDFHVLQVLLQRGWGVFAGAMTVLIVPLVLSGIEQGYYYTFSSLLALQVFFELGFNVVILQLVGHEAARLEIADDGSVSGDPASAARLHSLLRMLRRWYLGAALLFAAAVSIAGFVFFQRQGGMATREWAGVWLALVGLTSVNLYLSPQLAVLEGIGRVGHVARLRLMQSVVGSLAMWAGFALGAGLRAVPLLTAAAALGSLLWLRHYGGLLKPRIAVPGNGMRWRTDIFPLQWRIALSWISGWFIFYAFTPLLFARQGAVEAGRLGLALSLFSSVSMLGMSWVNAAAPRMVQHIARGERAALNQLFVRVLKSATAFTALVSLALLAAVALMIHWDLPLAQRIAPMPVLACLALVTLINGFVFAAATYMRAHKAEPLLTASVVGGVLTLLAAWYGSQAGAATMMGLYAASSFFVGLPWTILHFRRYFVRTA